MSFRPSGVERRRSVLELLRGRQESLTIDGVMELAPDAYVAAGAADCRADLRQLKREGFVREIPRIGKEPGWTATRASQGSS